MERQVQLDARFLPSRRWFLLVLSVLVPLVLLSVALLSVRTVEAEPMALPASVSGTAGSVEAYPLAPASTISGTVINPDGSAITDTAWVCLMHLYPGEDWVDWEDCQDSTANGSFSFTDTIPLGDLFVVADPPWYSEYFPSAPHPLYLASPSGIIALGNVTLTYASFAGMVYDPYGGLAPEGLISVEAFDGENWFEVAGGEYYTGAYAVGGVPSGTFTLMAHPPRDSMLWGSPPEPVTVTAGSQYDLNATQLYSLTLQEPNLAGQVVYPDGSPVTWIISDTDIIGEAWVEATSLDWSVNVDRPTDFGGGFGFLVPPDDYRVWARPEGILVMTYTKSLPRHILAGGTLWLPTGPLTLTYPSFTGTVYYPDSSVVTECLNIRLLDEMDNYLNEFYYCGDWGPYRLGGLEGGCYNLQAIPPLGSPLFPSDPISGCIVPGEQYDPLATQNINLYLLDTPSSGVFGTIVNPDSSPIIGQVSVCLEHLHPEGWADWSECADAVGTDYGGVGSFYIPLTRLPPEFVPGGDFVIRVDPYDNPHHPPLPVPVWIDTVGDVIDMGDIPLGAAQLSVSVVDPTGKPTPATVVLRNYEWYEDWQPSQPGAPAEFGGVEPGDYWVRAWPGGPDIPALANSTEEWVWVDVMTPTQMTLVLQTPNITGTIETPEGNPLPPAFDWDGNPIHPAEIHVHDVDWMLEDIWAITNITGEFSLNLPDADYNLVAYPMGSLNARYNKSGLVQFALPGPSNLGYIPLSYPRIVGVVVDPDGNRVSTGVSLWSDSGYNDWDDTFWYGDDDEKPFRLGGMPGGHYYVQADPPWDNPEGYGQSDIYEFDVPPTVTQFITLTMQMPNVSGWVYFPPNPDCVGGCPAPWADVRLQWPDPADPDWPFEMETQTDGNGLFTFSGLTATVAYTLTAFPAEHMRMEWDNSLPDPFTLAAADAVYTTTLELRPALRNKLVEGRVLYGDDSPVGDAIVSAAREDAGGWADAPTDPTGAYEMYLSPGLWRLWVEPMYPDVDWYFDSAWEEWVWFTPTLDFEVVPLTFTVERWTEGEYFQVTGVITTPDASTIAADTVEAELCNDVGECFYGPAAPNGSFTAWAAPGHYNFGVWVDPVTGFMPPLCNDFPLVVDADVDLLTDPPSCALPDGILVLRSAQNVRTAEVQGRVMITGTGTAKNAVGFMVEAWTDEGDWNEAQTNADGRYTMRLSPGTGHVGLALTPEQENQYIVLPPEIKHRRLADGETATANFYLLERDATIRGRLVIAGTTTPITDVEAMVFAERCEGDDCWPVAKDKANEGSFELKVLGGRTYSLTVWVMSGGYMPGPLVTVTVARDETKTGVELELVEAGTRIWGRLHDGETGLPIDGYSASVYGVSSDGDWAEDALGVGKDRYNLNVPTPVTDPVTWTLRLWVDPPADPAKPWYIADPAKPYYQVVVNPGRETVWQPLSVRKLDTQIIGSVKVGNVAAPYVWVFAEGAVTETADLYFEARTDASGVFTMPVFPGEYQVGAYLPPDLQDSYFPPLLQTWSSMGDNPIDLVFRLRPTVGLLEIVGSLSVTPTGALPLTTTIQVFGDSQDDSVQVTGTLGAGYRFPVISNTTWHIWASYEDTGNGAFYHSREVVVDVKTSPVTAPDIRLWRAYDLPEGECWDVSPLGGWVILPRRGVLLPPTLAIQAGTFSDTVKICATPTGAVPDGQRLVGFAYELTARDSQGRLIEGNFDKKVRLSFYFSEDALNSVPIATGYGYPEPNDLKPVYYSTERNEWIALDDPFVDEEDQFVTGKINHFTRMGVMGTTPYEGGYSIYLPLVLRND